jgi:hypothetical protein
MDFGGSGSIVEWNKIDVPSDGQYTLVFRYANGGGDRPCFINVNDTVRAGNVSFSPTGSWKTWKTASITVDLKAGINKIRVTADTGAGGPNLDKMDVMLEENDAATGCVAVGEGKSGTLSCPNGQVITSIDFASYGKPTGSCEQAYAMSPSCHAAKSQGVVEGLCLERNSCTVSAKNSVFGDPCPGTYKHLHVTYSCREVGCVFTDESKPERVTFWGGLPTIVHEPTRERGAGKFVFNRIYRANKYDLDWGEQFGVFHWWLKSDPQKPGNVIESGVWVNPGVTGQHYYPTLHLAGLGDRTNQCSDLNFGSGFGHKALGNQWLTMIQLSNRVLTVPGVNIAFDNAQNAYENDNGIWLGWGWTALDLEHPEGLKYWMSVVETFNYQGPINGYLPEHFLRQDDSAVLVEEGATKNWILGNEQRSYGMKLGDDIYYVPVPKVPSRKDREYLVANVQDAGWDEMDAYSSALRSNPGFDMLLPTRFLSFTGLTSTTHSKLKIIEKDVDGARHRTVIEPPYSIGYESYRGYVQWPTATESDAALRFARGEGNGYLYYRKTDSRWPLEDSAGDDLKNDPHLYKGELVDPGACVHPEPKVATQYLSFLDRDYEHADFSHWLGTANSSIGVREVRLQNGSIATYGWVKFSEQPALLAARENWPDIYTEEYLGRLQSYIENLHRAINTRGKVGPSDPVFIDYRPPKDTGTFDPHLVHIEPNQVVKPPAGYDVGYVPVVLSVYHPGASSKNGHGVISAPDALCGSGER